MALSYPSQKSFSLEGRVHTLFDIAEISPNLTKRDMVMGVAKGAWLGPDISPELVKIEFTQHNVPLLDKLKVGDDVRIHFNILGRVSHRYQEPAYFVVLSGWKVEVADKWGTYNDESIPNDGGEFTPNTIRLSSRLGPDKPSAQPFPRFDPESDNSPPPF